MRNRLTDPARGPALSVLVVMLACGGTESSWTGTITDSAGVTMVSNPSEGIWTEKDQWTVEPEVRIGTVQGGPDYEFGEIGGITVDSRGRVFVLDVQAQHIKVFSPDGTYEQTIGGPGGGPGELAAAYFSPGVVAGDTLLVPDVFGNRRINRYAPDGSDLESLSIPTQLGGVFALATTPAGAVALQVRLSRSPRQSEAESIDAIVTLSTDGVVTDTLLTFPSGRTFVQGSGQLTLLAPEPVWAITQDSKLLFGMDDQYRIGVYHAGELERVIEKPSERRPITDRDKEFEWGVPPDARAYIRVVDSYPAFNDIIAGPEGTIWVQHVMAISEMSDADRRSLGSLAGFGRWVQMIPHMMRDFHGAPGWDVFDADGRFLGVITMPSRLSLQVIRGDKVYGIMRDSLDVEYAVRLRIVGDAGR